MEFQTCTIINANLDPDSNNKVLFESVETKVDGKNVKALKVKRDFLFVKDNVVAIRKRAGYMPAACKATIDFSTLMEDIKAVDEDKYCRLEVYVKYEGAEPFYGSNPIHVQKGIPFWVEFTVTKNDTAVSIAEKIKKQIKRDNLFLIDKDIINIEVDGSTLILEGATEYLRFGKITISSFDLTSEYAEIIAELSKEAPIKLEERGYNGFGTYSQIIKDLRLPTAANFNWTHIRQVETPVVGGVYDQYIIEYCAPATNYGTQFVGHRGMSNTTHVFWVKIDAELIAEWNQAISSTGLTVDTICCEGVFEKANEEANEEVNEEVTE